MPKKTVVITVCALCESTPAAEYQIRLPDGRKAKLDLCKKCAAPLHHLVNRAPEGTVSQGTRKRGMAALDELIVDLDNPDS